MKTLAKIASLIVSVAFLAGVASTADQAPPAAAPAAEPVQTGTPHPFVCADYSGAKVFVVSAQGKVEWEYPAPSCNDVWLLPNGNLLFVTGHGVKEVSRDKKVVFEHTGTKVATSKTDKDGKVTVSEGPSEIYACQRLANGNTFVGECNSGHLLEIDPSGKIVKDIALLPEGKNGGHGFIRNARVLANGNYLVTHCLDDVVKEYDPQGKVVREIKAAGHPHSVIRLPNGNTLIACGDGKGGPRVFEVDKDDKTVWEVKEGDLPGVHLKFLTGIQRLPNGNTVLTNWQGHVKGSREPQVIEVTPDKKIAWTFADFATMKTVSSIQLIDVPGDATKGEILH